MTLSLRKVNNVLLVAVVAVNLYILAVPFLPQVLFSIGKNSGEQQKLEASIHQKPPTTPSASAPANSGPAASTGQQNQLIIPSMILNQPIVENSNMYRGLDQGVWRWPGGSTPDKGGNTVLLGHRFTYTKPKGVFYFLDKVHQGDSIGIYWSGKTYLYKVTSTEVVSPTQTSILNASEQPTLTVYTCTPLWLPKNRLVVHAALESIQ